MLQSAALPVGSPEYASLGLWANPFRSSAWKPSTSAHAELLTHAAAVELIGSLSSVAEAGQGEAVRVEAEARVPDYYQRMPVSEVMYALTGNGHARLLVANVPFTMMRIGRVRSALSVLAERLAADSFGETIGTASAYALREREAALLEQAGLTEAARAEFESRFEADPEGTAEEVFGECVDTRTAGEGLDSLMRETAARQGLQPADPEEAEESAETDASTENPAHIPGVLPASEPAEEAGDSEEEAPLTDAERVRAYVIAFVRAKFSPVIARGLKSYVNSGSDALAQELKITKAPRKTLKALARLATLRFRAVVLLYDDFGSWSMVPDDLRAKIVGSLSELRWTLKPEGIVALVLPSGTAPEIEEQFAGARRVAWEMRDALIALEGAEDIAKDLAMSLLDRCARDAGPSEELRAEVARIHDETEGRLEEFANRAGALIDEKAGAAA